MTDNWRKLKIRNTVNLSGPLAVQNFHLIFLFPSFQPVFKSPEGDLQRKIRFQSPKDLMIRKIQFSVREFFIRLRTQNPLLLHREFSRSGRQRETGIF